MKHRQIRKNVIKQIMDYAGKRDRNAPEHCRDFSIMISDKYKKTLILRWLTIDISDPDRPLQQYRYECFDLKGNPKGCSIHYSNQEEANTFFEGLTRLYKQEYSITP